MISCNYSIFTGVKYENCRTVSQRKYDKRRLNKMLLELLLLGFWLAFIVYCFWYFFLAKTFQPLTLDDLALIWRLHKQQTGCKASRIHSLLERNNEVVGFKCECGYEFQQKRLITQRIIKTHISSGHAETAHYSKSSGSAVEEKQ